MYQQGAPGQPGDPSASSGDGRPDEDVVEGEFSDAN
jgi:hypothetical protein